MAYDSYFWSGMSNWRPSKSSKESSCLMAGLRPRANFLHKISAMRPTYTHEFDIPALDERFVLYHFFLILNCP